MKREKATAGAIVRNAAAGAQAIARVCVKPVFIRASAGRLEKGTAAAIANSAEDKTEGVAPGSASIEQGQG